MVQRGGRRGLRHVRADAQAVGVTNHRSSSPPRSSAMTAASTAAVTVHTQRSSPQSPPVQYGHSDAVIGIEFGKPTRLVGGGSASA